jgi:hypothetical protein
MVFGVWPLTRMRVSESSSPNNIFSMNSMLDEAALPTTRAALSPHHSNARHHTGRRSSAPKFDLHADWSPSREGSAEDAADSPGTPWVVQRSPAAGGVPRPLS